MNCVNCGSFLVNDGRKFCSGCGAERSQQLEVPQPEKKKFPVWAIVLIVIALLFFLTLCCVGVFVVADRQGIFNEPVPAVVDAELDYGEEDRVATLEDRITALAENHDLYTIPTDEEIIAFMEDAHGVDFEIYFCARDSEFPALALQALYDDYPDVVFFVQLTDVFTGEYLPLGEMRSDFVFILAGRTTQEIFDSLVEDIFDVEKVEWTLTRYFGAMNDFSLPIGLNWDSDTGTTGLQQLLTIEFEDELHLNATVVLCENYDIKDVSWEQLEKLAEMITEAGIYGIDNTLSVRVPAGGDPWSGDAREINWRAQNGGMYSLSRHKR